MQVGVFSYYYLPVVNGVTLSIADWKKWAQKEGTYFTICVPKLSGQKHADPDVFEYPSIPLWRWFGITVPIFPENAIEKELGDKKVAILHAHHPFYVGNLALAAKRALGVPLVFTYHTRYSDYTSSYFPLVSKKFARSVVNAAMARFMNKCDAVTVANDTLKHELLKFGVRVPIFLVSPGIDTKKYSSGNREKTRKRLGLFPHDVALLYVGRLAKEKNIYFLMRAFVTIAKRMPQTKLVLAGNGLELGSLVRFVRRKKLTGRVIFADRESPDSIVDIYAAADMFIYASQTETFGRVIVEAMSAGLPVVALAGPSIVDILRDDMNGKIVFKKSPKQFAQTVIALLSDPKKFQYIGEAGKQESIREYDSGVSWKKLHHVYETVTRA